MAHADIIEKIVGQIKAIHEEHNRDYINFALLISVIPEDGTLGDAVETIRTAFYDLDSVVVVTCDGIPVLDSYYIVAVHFLQS